MILSSGSILNGRYSIQSVLGDVGPFDVSYLAWDVRAEAEVVVREYYPLRLAQRGRDGATLEVSDPRGFEYGLGAYLAEGALLMEIAHPQVVACTDQFKQHGTAYRVSPYLSGATLGAFIRQHQGRIPEEEALSLFRQVLDALEACHVRGVYHAGISPRTIYMTLQGQPMLIAFQTARFKAARRMEALPDIAQAGYTAPELLGAEAPDGPWWDVYGCAATLLFMLSGRVPPAIATASEAGRIQTALHRASGISPELRGVLERALAFHPIDRPAGAAALGQLLAGVGARRLHTAARQTLHVHVEHEEAGSDALWHHDIELVPTTPLETVPPEPAPSEPTTRAAQAASRTAPPVEDRPMTPHETPDIVPRTPSYPASIPPPSEGRSHELEQLVVKMVKWQQVFVGSILAVVFLALIGVLGGLFLAPGLAQRLFTSDPVPGPAAEAQAAPPPAAALAIVPAPVVTDTTLVAVSPVSELPAIEEEPELDFEPIAAVDREDPPAREPEPRPTPPARETPREEPRQESRPETLPPVVETTPEPATEVVEVVPEPVPSEPAPPAPSPQELAAQIRAEQFQYYRAQGDSLMRLGRRGSE